MIKYYRSISYETLLSLKHGSQDFYRSRHDEDINKWMIVLVKQKMLFKSGDYRIVVPELLPEINIDFIEPNKKDHDLRALTDEFNSEEEAWQAAINA